LLAKNSPRALSWCTSVAKICYFKWRTFWRTFSSFFAFWDNCFLVSKALQLFPPFIPCACVYLWGARMLKHEGLWDAERSWDILLSYTFVTASIRVKLWKLWYGAIVKSSLSLLNFHQNILENILFHSWEHSPSFLRTFFLYDFCFSFFKTHVGLLSFATEHSFCCLAFPLHIDCFPFSDILQRYLFILF